MRPWHSSVRILALALLLRSIRSFCPWKTNSCRFGTTLAARNSTSGVGPVQLQLHELTTRYPDCAPEAWAKTRNYLYHNTQLTRTHIRQVCDFLDATLEDENVVVSLLQSSPRILRKAVSTGLEPTLEFLRDLYGTDLLKQALQRKPELLLTRGLGYTQDELALVEVVLHEYMSDSQIARLKKTAPFVFTLSVSQLLSSYDYLTHLLRAAGDGHDDAKIRTALAKLTLTHPEILRLSVEENLKPRISFLCHRCDLDEADVASLLQSSNAAILGLSVSDNLRPTLNFLEDYVQGADLRKCFLSHPPLLGLSLTNLREKAAYLEAIGGPTLTARVLLRAPAVLSLRLDHNIRPTVDFLSKTWNATGDTLASLLGEYPTILTLSLEGNLQPTVNFFNRTGYIELDEDWNLQCDTVLRGRYLAASLFNRLLPRWHYCLSLELPRPPLHLLVGATDIGFCDALELDLLAYREFKTESIPRLKFSSQFDTWLKTGRPMDSLL